MYKPTYPLSNCTLNLRILLFFPLFFLRITLEPSLRPCSSFFVGEQLSCSMLRPYQFGPTYSSCSTYECAVLHSAKSTLIQKSTGIMLYCKLMGRDGYFRAIYLAAATTAAATGHVNKCTNLNCDHG